MTPLSVQEAGKGTSGIFFLCLSLETAPSTESENDSKILLITLYTKTLSIDAIHKWLPIHYSFVLVQISLPSLIVMY